MSLMNIIAGQQITPNIDVVASTQQPPPPPVTTSDTGPSIVPELPESQIKHKGLFGVKGSLRDILGVLGDAFLVQSGNPRIYAPNRRREIMGEQLGNYDGQNAQGVFQNLARLGHVDQAMTFLKQHNDREHQIATENWREDSVAGRAAVNESLVRQREMNRIESAQEQLRNILYRLPAEPLVRQGYAELYAKNTGLSLDQLGIYDLEDIDNWIMAGIDPTQDQKFIRQDRRQAETERSNRVREGLSSDRNEISREGNQIRRENNEARQKATNRRLDQDELEYRNSPEGRRGNRNTEEMPRYVRQNGILYDTETGRPVSQ